MPDLTEILNDTYPVGDDVIIVPG
nr:hypothetical protein LRH_13851 [Lacticaseibacillus rhamnosus HN001]